jgi:adenylosuccinate lyase
VALELREGRDAENDLLDRLADDPRLGLDRESLGRLIDDPLEFTGAARAQVGRVVEQVAAVVARYPDAGAYAPGDIL